MKKLVTVFALCFTANAFASEPVMPFGNGAWVYDATYLEKTGAVDSVKAGLFADAIARYNHDATEAHKIDQVFAYGGSVEMYCAGSGESDAGEPCLPNNFILSFYPPDRVSNGNNNWDDFFKRGDSGFASLEQYSGVEGVNTKVIVIDGRVDMALIGGFDYLDHLNTLSAEDASHFADKVAKMVCASDSIDGVQFDIEPFSFSGEGGTAQGPGQEYFYTEIAKDFAGYYGNVSDPEGINSNAAADPLRCVDKKHPEGRFFSVFTFSGKVTPDVVTVFTHHGNGMIVDSLYDLGDKPGGSLNTLDEFSDLVRNEVAMMKTKGVPYQFAIPAVASAHEFESKGGVPTGVAQEQYVTVAINAIQPDVLRLTDPNFKGVDVWSWVDQMWWKGDEYTPAVPSEAALRYLQFNL